MKASTHVSVSGSRGRDRPIPEHPVHYLIPIDIAHHTTLHAVTEYSADLAGGWCLGDCPQHGASKRGKSLKIIKSPLKSMDICDE